MKSLLDPPEIPQFLLSAKDLDVTPVASGHVDVDLLEMLEYEVCSEAGFEERVLLVRIAENVDGEVGENILPNGAF